MTDRDEALIRLLGMSDSDPHSVLDDGEDIVLLAWEKLKERYEIGDIEKGEAEFKPKGEHDGYYFWKYTYSHGNTEDELFELKITRRRYKPDTGERSYEEPGSTLGKRVPYREGLAALDSSPPEVSKTSHLLIEPESVSVDFEGVPKVYKMYGAPPGGTHKLCGVLEDILTQANIPRK